MRQRDDMVFPTSEYERRISELRGRMAEKGAEVMLVTSPENIAYLTAFESPGYFWWEGVLIPLTGEPVAVPRRLEALGFDVLTWLENIRPYEDVQDPMDKLAQVVEEFGWQDKAIGYEKDCWFFTACQQERLFPKLPNAKFVDCSGIVEQGRVIKSKYEIDLMRKTARLTEAGIQAGIDAVHAGVTEDEVAAEMLYSMTKAGSQWPGIVPFVASGPRGAIGHATWMGRTVQEGEIVFLETAGCLRRYHTAMMRGVSVGQPSDKLLRAEDFVIQAVEAVLANVKPGMTAAEADAINRKILAQAVEGGTQSTRSAYSIGIAVPPDWGEGQILSWLPTDNRVLKPGMTFHLIPWVQVAGEAGVGCSETILINETGCESLTNFERKLFVK